MIIVRVHNAPIKPIKTASARANFRFTVSLVCFSEYPEFRRWRSFPPRYVIQLKWLHPPTLYRVVATRDMFFSLLYRVQTLCERSHLMLGSGHARRTRSGNFVSENTPTQAAHSGTHKSHSGFFPPFSIPLFSGFAERRKRRHVA